MTRKQAEKIAAAIVAVARRQQSAWTSTTIDTAAVALELKRRAYVLEEQLEQSGSVIWGCLPMGWRFTRQGTALVVYRKEAPSSVASTFTGARLVELGKKEPDTWSGGGFEGQGAMNEIDTEAIARWVQRYSESLNGNNPPPGGDPAYWLDLAATRLRALARQLEEQAR